jgi:hypothetical protein
MAGLTMATNIMNDDRDNFHLFIHDKLNIIWVCMDNAFSGPTHYCCYYYLLIIIHTFFEIIDHYLTHKRYFLLIPTHLIRDIFNSGSCLTGCVQQA